jgi:hypothetical protein
MALDADIKADNLQCNIPLHSFMPNEVEPSIPFEVVFCVLSGCGDGQGS